MCTSCEVLFFLPSLVLFEITTLIKLSKMQVFHMPGVKRKLGRGKVVMGFRFIPRDLFFLVSLNYQNKYFVSNNLIKIIITKILAINHKG